MSAGKCELFLPKMKYLEKIINSQGRRWTHRKQMQ